MCINSTTVQPSFVWIRGDRESPSLHCRQITITHCPIQWLRSHRRNLLIILPLVSHDGRNKKEKKWRWCWAGRSSECFRRDGGPTATNQPCWQSGELLIIPFIPHKILALCFKELISLVGSFTTIKLTRWDKKMRTICLGKASEAYMRHRANFNDGQFDNGFASTTAYAVTPQQAVWENILYIFNIDIFMTSIVLSSYFLKKAAILIWLFVHTQLPVPIKLMGRSPWYLY